MARYVVHVRSPKSPAESFAYMADLRNFAQWDPGVVKVEQAVGDGGGPDTEFDVTVEAVGRDLTLRYKTVVHQAPSTLVAKAKSNMFTSVDTVTVRPDGDGSVVTYDAELTLNGILGLADFALGFAFNNIGDKAAKGLLSALDGERVSA